MIRDFFRRLLSRLLAPGDLLPGSRTRAMRKLLESRFPEVRQ